MNNKNIRITLMMYPSRPAEYAVINELKNPRHRAARIRKLLISGLDKVPVADDFNAIEDVNQSPFRVAVTLFHDSADDITVINAYERIPRQRRQDWIRQRLVSGLASSSTESVGYHGGVTNDECFAVFAAYSGYCGSACVV